MPAWSRIHEGRPPGGAFDPDLAILANRLTGNLIDTPVLECAIAGPRLFFPEPCVAAWCGADCELPKERAFTVTGEVDVGRIRNGLRGWLAVRPASTLECHLSASVETELSRGDRLVIRAMPGPHLAPLREVECEVTPQLDRVGIRLRPLHPLGVSAPADLPSIGMQFGSVQLHPDGSLVAMGPDHPITGGYLQPLTVRWSERWKLAQLTPGERVRFIVA